MQILAVSKQNQDEAIAAAVVVLKLVLGNLQIRIRRQIMFKGSIVAIVTPFSNGKVDEKKLRDLIEFQVKNGISGIVPFTSFGTLDNTGYSITAIRNEDTIA